MQNFIGSLQETLIYAINTYSFATNKPVSKKQIHIIPAQSI